MKSLDVKKVEKFEQVYLPCFSLSIEEEPISTLYSDVTVADDGTKMSAGSQSSRIALTGQLEPSSVSTLDLDDEPDWPQLTSPPSQDQPATPITAFSNSLLVSGDFIFAISDQELEVNHIEPALVLACPIRRNREWTMATRK